MDDWERKKASALARGCTCEPEPEPQCLYCELKAEEKRPRRETDYERARALINDWLYDPNDQKAIQLESKIVALMREERAATWELAASRTCTTSDRDCCHDTAESNINAFTKAAEEERKP